LPYIRVPSAEAEEARDFGLLVVRPKVQVETVLAALRLSDWFEDQSGRRYAVGRISNSSGASFSTTHPSALAHHRPNSTGSAASTTTCSHSRPILGIYGRHAANALLIRAPRYVACRRG